jgi:H(+)-translocating pyrophosphatase
MLKFNDAVIIIFSLCLLGILFAFYCVICVITNTMKPVVLEKDPETGKSDKENEDLKENEVKNDENEEKHAGKKEITQEQIDKLIKISSLIKEGAKVFLYKEYLYMFVFIVLFGTAIFFTCEHIPGKAYTTIAFVTGAVTSIICGYIGMMIATSTNSRTCYNAHFGLGPAFKVAYQGGCVMGFSLVSISLATLMLIILVYKNMLITPFSKLEEYQILYESIAGYGLGGSSVALFCRVGGGIYTKAADVGADLVGKLSFSLEEDDYRNPACIADNVGDNVGDIAGMGSDLFGSLAESTCASLLVASTSQELVTSSGSVYPLLISAIGIFVCIIVAIYGFVRSSSIKDYDSLESLIKWQMIFSSILIVPCVYVASINCLPAHFSIGDKNTVSYKANVTQLDVMVCPVAGVILGTFVGVITEYYTSMTYNPVKSLIKGCKQGAAINVILGLALGYMSSVLPTILIAITVFISYSYAGMFGISLAALGMLGNLAISLAIDAYGPIADNAGGLAQMCELHPDVRKITDDLDSAGNTTAAIGKGFAIGSACLVALALYGAFITNAKIDKVILNSPLVFSGLLLGAMIPYLFSAYTMQAVGTAAQEMVRAVKVELEANLDENGNLKEFEPDYNNCIRIATDSSLNQMILPGCLVIFSPIVIGTLFGPKAVAGFLIGVIISGIQMATSSANTGGAWDNCKKSIKSKVLK